MKMHKEWARGAGLLALAAAMAMLTSSPAKAQSVYDAFKISYFDVATSAAPSRSGYGGPGISGGAGDNTVRLINGSANDTDDFGAMCAMIYVFDDFEEMQTCCGCPVTADGLRTLSVTNDLTFNFGVNKANLNAGVIEVVSSDRNFQFVNPPPAPPPPGTNGFCSPTGSFSNDPFNRAVDIHPEPAIKAYITRAETQEPGNIHNGKAVTSVSVDEFQDAPLDATHAEELEQKCEFLISGGSGAGVCTCGFGDNQAASSSTAHR